MCSVLILHFAGALVSELLNYCPVYLHCINTKEPERMKGRNVRKLVL